MARACRSTSIFPARCNNGHFIAQAAARRLPGAAGGSRVTIPAEASLLWATGPWCFSVKTSTKWLTTLWAAGGAVNRLLHSNFVLTGILFPLAESKALAALHGDLTWQPITLVCGSTA